MILPVVRGQSQRMMDFLFKILDIHLGWQKPPFHTLTQGFLPKMGARYYLFRVLFHNFHYFHNSLLEERLFGLSSSLY